MRLKVYLNFLLIDIFYIFVGVVVDEKLFVCVEIKLY